MACSAFLDKILVHETQRKVTFFYRQGIVKSFELFFVCLPQVVFVDRQLGLLSVISAMLIVLYITLDMVLQSR